MDLIYPVSYLVSLFGLVLWFYFQGNKPISRKMSALFLTGFFIYLFALSFSSGSTPYKFLILFRDMLVLGVVSQLTNILKKNKFVFLALLSACILVVYFAYFRVLQNTFPQLVSADFNPEGELLVEVYPDADITQFERLINRYGLGIEPAFKPLDGTTTDLDDFYLIDIPENQKKHLKQIYNVINRMDGVEWVEGNETIGLDMPEETGSILAASKFFLNDPGLREQWGFDAMEVDALHRLLSQSSVKPSKKALIAILDTGVDGKHEDLSAQYRSLKPKYDADTKGHGTHCAGIAAAVSNNGKGIASYSPSTGYVEVMSIKVLNDYGMGSQHSIMNGIIEAADAGADVISLSLGGRSIQKKQKAYNDAVAYANKKGAIVVAAAGNQNGNAKTIAPANAKGVITVAALDADLNKAAFSNTVEDLEFGISAPGVNIYSTTPGNHYMHFNGTSMATPYVSGLIGLLKAFYPALTTEEAYLILQKTGKRTADGAKTGYLIQPYQAILEILD